MEEKDLSTLVEAVKTVSKRLSDLKIWIVVLALLSAFSLFQWWSVENRLDERLQTLERQMFYRAKFEERVKAELNLDD